MQETKPVSGAIDEAPMTAEAFLTNFMRQIIHNPLERQRILHEAVAEMEAREAEIAAEVV